MEFTTTVQGFMKQAEKYHISAHTNIRVIILDQKVGLPTVKQTARQEIEDFERLGMLAAQESLGAEEEIEYTLADAKEISP